MNNNGAHPSTDNAGNNTALSTDGIAAVLDWWRLAGVEYAFADDPADWLAEADAIRATSTSLSESKSRAGHPTSSANVSASSTPAPPYPPQRPAKPQKSRIGGERTGWPQTLSAFHQWWLEEPSLDPDGAATARIAPKGEKNAALLVLVPMPEKEDRTDLLSGPQGRLIASMARAMGIAPGKLYLASALPAYTISPDWQALAASGLGDVLQHHLTLADPDRLLVLGPNIMPLLMRNVAPSYTGAEKLDIGGRAMPLLAAYPPGVLLERPEQRKNLWRQWLDWTALT